MTHHSGNGPVQETDDPSGRLIRPYAMTRGRTGAEIEIGLEAQIQSTSRAAARLGDYRWEARQLIELVQTPMALIEVAARLNIPIGVARVLVADLAADGSVVTHVPLQRNYASLLEKVLDGVHNL